MQTTTTLNAEQRQAILEDPERLLAREDLAATEKAAILRRLCHDECLRAIADGEGMGGGRPPRLALLRRALDRIEAD